MLYEVITTESGKSLYESVAERVEFLVEEGAYRPGERVPSIRNNFV